MDINLHISASCIIQEDDPRLLEDLLQARKVVVDSRLFVLRTHGLFQKKRSE